MTRSNSWRSTPLPAGWQRLQRRIARRDGNQCQLRYAGCQGYAPLGHGGQTDHIVPAWQGGSDADDNLQHTCEPCHAEKSRREAAEASRQWHDRRPKRKREEERHPGLID